MPPRRCQAPTGVDVVWDTPGHNDAALAAHAVADGQRILVTATSAGSTVPLARLYTRDVSVVGFVISRADVRDLAAAAALINQMLAGSLLITRIVDRLPLADTAAAHLRMEAGAVPGRLLVQP